MDRVNVISELLEWIERNLDSQDNRLSLDKVAMKSGYSKWHLQRMFKEITSTAIGAYIRSRRLSKAAVALRLTSRPILDIALQYRFDSQQTFTRAFKKQFAMTPAIYRRAPDWNAFGIRPPMRIGACHRPEHEFITLPPIELLGFTQSYTCSLEQISESRLAMRSQFWKQFFTNTPVQPTPPMLFGLHETRPSMEKEDEQELFYTTALPKQISYSYLHNVPGVQLIKLTGGDYIKFFYKGRREGLQEFVITLYSTCMPELNLTRRKGQDIEVFYPKAVYNDPDDIVEFQCDYLIPLRR